MASSNSIRQHRSKHSSKGGSLHEAVKAKFVVRVHVKAKHDKEKDIFFEQFGKGCMQYTHAYVHTDNPLVNTPPGATVKA